MRRLPLVVSLVLVAGVVAGSAGASGSPGPQIIESKGPAFPTRTFVLTLPSGRTLSVNDVTVTENGGAVADEAVIPASQTGTVLVLDTSYSMFGQPVSAAIAAEKAFAAHRKPEQKLGLIEFNKDTTVALPLTTSSTDIDAALAKTPHIAVGTHIYDAVAKAESMLASANISAGSIVLLSDGADTGSTTTLQQVTGQAIALGTRIYSVGLDDQSFDPAALKALATAGHGQYAQATAANLAPLYDRLGQLISNEYLLQYKSQMGPNKDVRVDVDVHGVGTASTGYRTPALSVSTGAPKPYSPSIESRILGSPITMLLFALIGAAAVAFLFIVILQPKRSTLPARMTEFVSIRGLQKDKGETAVVADENATGPSAWWTRFEETLEIAEIKIEPEFIVAGTIAATLLSFLLIYLAMGSVWWAFLAFVIPYLTRWSVLRTLEHRRNRFAEQLPDALQVIGSALRSGHSFAGALAVVVDSASEPMKSEMQRVVADDQLGIPVQDSLNVVAQRMASRDLEQLALVAQLQREAGGDAAEVIDTVAATVRERFDLKRMIQTLTMQGRMSRWIVSILPIFVVVVVYLENPDYFHPMTSTLFGRIVLILAAAWAIAGSFVIKRIVEIEV